MIHGSWVSHQRDHGNGDHHDVEKQECCNQPDREPDDFVETTQEQGPEQQDQHQRDDHLLSIEPVGGEGVLNDVCRSIG